MLPYLIDLGMDRGVRFQCFNYAIGGASAQQYTGRIGGTVVGDPALPAQLGFFSGGEYTGGTSTCVEGDPGFDPFSLLSRTRACVQSLAGKYDAVVTAWSNGESDAGLPSASYQAALSSIANYLFASGVDAHLIGLSSKPPSASAANYNLLEAGRVASIAALRANGRPAFDGGNGWLFWGEDAPLYPETGGTRVHLTLAGQRQHATLWNDALQAAGF